MLLPAQTPRPQLEIMKFCCGRRRVQRSLSRQTFQSRAIGDGFRMISRESEMIDATGSLQRQKWTRMQFGQDRRTRLMFWEWSPCYDRII